MKEGYFGTPEEFSKAISELKLAKPEELSKMINEGYFGTPDEFEKKVKEGFLGQPEDIQNKVKEDKIGEDFKNRISLFPFVQRKRMQRWYKRGRG